MESEKPLPIHEDEHKHVHTHTLKRQLVVSISILVFLVAGTTLAVLYGKGYRFFVKKGEPQVSKTGILRVTSLPPGAQVYINDHLTTATDNSLNLAPDKYKVKIAKDGYQDWQKDFEIQREVVQNANATLYPKSPTLQSISTLGVESVIVDPSGTKLAFKIASNSAKNNGIYVFDMTARTFPVLAGQSSSTQLASDSTDIFSKAQLQWSPDGKQILATIVGAQNKTTYYLLKTDGMNDNPQDVTTILATVQETWATQIKDKDVARKKSLKPALRKFAEKNFRIIAWSPDDDKILYQASESGQVPVFLKPRRIGNNSLYERRDLEKDAVYSYNIKEDINTRITESTEEFCLDPKLACMTPFTWFSDSEHLLYVHDKKIQVIEEDGSNLTTIYAGPFMDQYVFPWPDGSKIVILTNLNNTTVSPTLYSIGLK
jgi:hypothetical protein